MNSRLNADWTRIYEKAGKATMPTLCGRRALLEQIDDENPTCRNCLQTLENAVRAAEAAGGVSLANKAKMVAKLDSMKRRARRRKEAQVTDIREARQ